MFPLWEWIFIITFYCPKKVFTTQACVCVIVEFVWFESNAKIHLFVTLELCDGSADIAVHFNSVKDVGDFPIVQQAKKSVVIMCNKY